MKNSKKEEGFNYAQYLGWGMHYPCFGHLPLEVSSTISCGSNSSIEELKCYKKLYGNLVYCVPHYNLEVYKAELGL